MIVEEMHTIVLANLFGLYLVIMAILHLARGSYYREMINNLKIQSGSVYVASSFGLLIGLLLVSVHNNWAWDTDVFVTILGWLILVKSLLWLGFPAGMLRFSKKMYSGAGYYITLIIMFVVGVLLLSKGTYLFI